MAFGAAEPEPEPEPEPLPSLELAPQKSQLRSCGQVSAEMRREARFQQPADMWERWGPAVQAVEAAGGASKL